MDALLLKTFGTCWLLSDGREITGYLQRTSSNALDAPEAFFDSKRWYFYTDTVLLHNETMTGNGKTYIVKITESDAAVTFAEGQADDSLQLNRYLVIMED